MLKLNIKESEIELQRIAKKKAKTEVRRTKKIGKQAAEFIESLAGQFRAFYKRIGYSKYYILKLVYKNKKLTLAIAGGRFYIENNVYPACKFLDNGTLKAANFYSSTCGFCNFIDEFDIAAFRVYNSSQWRA